MKRLALGHILLSLLLFPIAGKAQLNAYAEVTNISGPASVDLANVDETDDSFEDGENVIIMQMQDDVIFGNPWFPEIFGEVVDIGSAGLWEIRKIDSHTEGGGVPTSVTFKDPLNNVYNTGTNSNVQLISYPKLGAPDHTMTADQSPRAWDGTTGGVLAFEVPGTLTLESNIDADGAGFRGGDAANGSSGACDGDTYLNGSSGQNGDKGEGIQPTEWWYEAGRGRLANGGGGGGNEHNAGGGGGGNFSAGGEGGPGWNCNPGEEGSGFGGTDLSADISAFRFFMGGGGGGGEGNDGLATDGGDGGGIVIIKAEELETSPSCGGGVSISADGENAADLDNDGAGGGGAGGTVHMHVNTWNVDPACPLDISSNGGSGGDIENSGVHGGGGGGGQGAVIQAGNTPTNNVDQDTEPGDGGENCDGCATTDPGGGNDDDGVSSGGTSPLPIELVSFEAEESGDRVELTWKTLSEKDNDRFELHRSKRGENWEHFETVEGAGDASSERNYRTYDRNPFTGISYYKLEQIDYDGERSSFGPIKVRFERQEPLSIHPNPTKERLYLRYSEPIERIRVYDPQGRNIAVPITLNGTDAELSVSDLSPGVYFLKVHTPHGIARKRFVKE